MKIKLKDTDKIQIAYPEDVYAIMQRILLRENKVDRSKEHFWLIGLNAQSTILFIELVILGSVTEETIEPIQVFRVAVLKDAVSVILIHNRPSGELEPHKADQKITDRLIQSGRILDIKVIEHLIINEKEHYSFSKSGLLAEIEKNSGFLIGFEQEDQIRNQAEAIGEQKGEKRRSKEIAKILKEQGLSIEAIKTATGLKESEIIEL